MAKKPTKKQTSKAKLAIKRKLASQPKKKHHLARDKPPTPKQTLTQSKKDTPEKLAKFLARFMQTFNITESARMAGVSRQTINTYRDDDPIFAKAYDLAAKIAFENLECEAFRRAFQGTLKPVFSFGKVCGHIREFSDTLTIFLLKGNNKEKYGDTMKLKGDASAPLLLTFTPDLTKPENAGN